MFNQRLPEFNVVTAGRTSQLKVPKYELSLKKLDLILGGGGNFDNTKIDEIRVKIATKTIWQIRASELMAINKYHGKFDKLGAITLDFSDRDMKNIVAEEVGGIDLSKLKDDVYIEVDINGTATTPTMYCVAWFTPPQGDSEDPRQLVKKFVRMTFNAAIAGNKNSLPFDPQGAQVLRAYIVYTGTDVTAPANGNINKVEVKKNGIVVSELMDLDARYEQAWYKKVPQSRVHVVDFCVDNNLSGALTTEDAKALEWNLYPTAADTPVVIFEVLDKPYNL